MDSVVSLYCLDNDDEFLGCCEAEHVGLSWLSFETVTPGSLFLSSRRLLFEPRSGHTKSAPILTFQLADVDDLVVNTQTAPFCLSFHSSCHTEGATRHGDALVGPWQPVQHATHWRFRFPPSVTAAGAAEDWWASLNTLVTGGIERRLQQREHQIQSAHAECASFPVKRVLPLREQRGVLLVGPDRISFEPLFALGRHTSCPLASSEVSFVFPRWVLFEDVGIEFYHTDPETVGTARELCCSVPLLSLTFFSSTAKREAMRALGRLSSIHAFQLSLTALTRSWQLRELSNYEYLSSLNLLASRSRLDLYQYPVFPWVLQDYSADLDIQHPSAYRDLSKPIGALSPSRLEQLRARADVLVDMGQPFCLYTSHYSSAWAVSYYLVRSHPEYQFCLQGGRFDSADRLFECLATTWANVNRGSSDFKELIPEFFEDAFVTLAAPPPPPRRIALGTKQDGSPVAPRLVLPPAATSAEAFLRMHRAALESEYVSSTLHLWIDLIFGIKQDGADAQLAANVFHPYCYPPSTHTGSEPMGNGAGGVCGGSPAGPRTYAREFGNVPMKLFTALHPGRNSYTSETQQSAYVRSITRWPHQRDGQSAVEAALWDGDVTTSPPDTALSPTTCSSRFSDAADQSDAQPDAAGTEENPAVQEVSLRAIPIVCGLRETSRLATCVRHPHALLLSVFTVDRADGSVQQRATVTIVEQECESVLVYDGLSGDRLRCFSDFDSPIAHTDGYYESVFLFTERGALYVLDASTCTVVGHIPAVSHGSAVRRCSFAPTVLAFVDTESRITVWRTREGGVEASLSTPPAGQIDAPAAVTCLCVYERADSNACDGHLHVAACTTANELLQCCGQHAESYTAHPLPPSLGSASAVAFTSTGDVTVFLALCILTLRAEDGVFVRQLRLPHAVLAAPAPLLYDGADYLVPIEGSNSSCIPRSHEGPEGNNACRLLLVRDGYMSGGVAVDRRGASPTTTLSVSAEYFLLVMDPHSGNMIIYSVDASE